MRLSIGGPGAYRPSPMVSTVGIVAVIALALGLTKVVLYSPEKEATSPSPSVSTTTEATMTPGWPAEPTENASPTPAATMIGTGFTTPGVLTSWTGFTWTAIPDSSPIRTPITNVLRWSRGYVANAACPLCGPTRGLWTSADAQHWTPVTSIDAPAVFVTAAPAGLVAIGVDPEAPYLRGAVWTSPDGITWTTPGASGLGGTLISIAGTQTGIVATVDTTYGAATTSETDTLVVEFSVDGVHWTPEQVAPGLVWSVDSPPPTVQSNGARFFLIGVPQMSLSSDGRQSRIVFTSSSASGSVWWSDDGRTWSRSGGSFSGFAQSIDFGRDGMLLHTNFGQVPGGVGLARSSDGGRTWIPDGNFGPLGAAPLDMGAGSVNPDGWIASNGTYFLAVKNNGMNAWLSYDGHTWSPIAWAGGEPATEFVMVPRGVIAAQYGAAR
jgi:hypothetical protein